MKEGKGNTVLLTIIGIATLLVAVVGATFAYFTAMLTGEETDTTVKVISGSIGTVFEGGEIITASDIYPRDEVWATKTFSIKHSNDGVAGTRVPYSLGLVVDSNTFSADDLKYKFLVAAGSSANGEKAPEKTELTNIPLTGVVDFGTGNFISPTGGEAIHTYNLEIFFPDTGVPQNESQGKEFKAHILIDDAA